MKNINCYLRIETDPHVYNISPSGSIGGAQIVNRLMITDSIFDFYPYGEIVWEDQAGIVIEAGGPVEEAKFSIEFGNDEVDPFTVDMALQRVDMPSVYPEYSVKGDSLQYLKSWYKTLDKTGRRVLNGTLSDAITDITADFNFNSTTISEMSNSGTWLQGDKRISDFLKNHSRITNANDSTPVFTFVNNKGNFHFMSVADLHLAESIVTTPYEFVSSSDTSPGPLSNNRIMSLQVAFLGSEVNKNNYFKNVHSMSSDNEFVLSSEDLLSHLPSDMPGMEEPVLPVYEDKLTVLKDEIYTGIEWDTTKGIHQGLINNSFVDSAFPYRMVLNIPFNAKICAGKTIPIKIYTAFPEKKGASNVRYRVAPEYSGNWVILKSTFVWSKETAAPFFSVVVGRSKMEFNQENLNRGSFAH